MRFYTPCHFIKQLESKSVTSSQAFIPLQFNATDALQFDWSEIVVVLGGIEEKDQRRELFWPIVDTLLGSLITVKNSEYC